LLEDIRKQGFVRVRIDGELVELTDDIKLYKNKKHNIEVVVDRLIIREGIENRLTDSIETVMSLSGGLMIVDVIDGDEIVFSQNYACPHCNISIEELTPRLFSFNNPFGACEKCDGLGVLMEIDPELVIPNKALALTEGAINAPGWSASSEESMAYAYFSALGKEYGFNINTPVGELDSEIIDIILYGTGNRPIKVQYKNAYRSKSFSAPFEGVIPNLQRRYEKNQMRY